MFFLGGTGLKEKLTNMCLPVCGLIKILTVIRTFQYNLFFFLYCLLNRWKARGMLRKQKLSSSTDLIMRGTQALMVHDAQMISFRNLTKLLQALPDILILSENFYHLVRSRWASESKQASCPHQRTN